MIVTYNFKFDIGDKVWVMKEDTPRYLTVEAIHVEDDEVKYKIQYYREYFRPGQLYASKVELLDSFLEEHEKCRCKRAMRFIEGDTVYFICTSFYREDIEHSIVDGVTFVDEGVKYSIKGFARKIPESALFETLDEAMCFKAGCIL